MAWIAALLIVLGFAPTSVAAFPIRSLLALLIMWVPLSPWLPLAIKVASALSPVRLPDLLIGFVAGMVLIAGAMLTF